MFYKILLIVYLLLGLLLARPTPLGEWPDQCVHQVPSGANLEYVEGGVMVHHPELPSFLLEEKPECVQHFQDFQEKHLEKRAKLAAQRELQQGGEPAPDAPYFWLDYADWTPPKPVGYFSGTYTVPGTPSADESQILYYFIGTENLDQSSQLSILQPVLTYSGKTNSLDPQGWSLASWNCCPSGQQHESTPITGFKPGDILTGIIDKISSNSTWTVRSTYQHRSTTINVPVASRKFDWVDVTLEVYNVEGCQDFAKGPATFDNMKMSAVDGSNLVPKWSDATGTTQCNGKVQVVSPQKVLISHSN